MIAFAQIRTRVIAFTHERTRVTAFTHLNKADSLHTC